MADTKKMTVKEFKMWLQGVEEMQPEDWAPDARQWNRIREKINLIDEAASVPVQQVTYRGGSAEFPAGMENVFPPMNTNPPAAGAVAPQPSALNVAPPAQPAARARTTASGMPVSLATHSNPAVPVKTPDIDTSKGNYKPQFE